MTLNKILNMNLGDDSYDIVVGEKLLNISDRYMNLDRKILIVTDDGVPLEYAETLASRCREPYILTIPAGEKSKNIKTFEYLLSNMLEHGFTRSDAVAAVGGGVVGDLSGFAAACYMRGIDFYNIPTTVLSCVDSSIGGKTAIDLNGVKNIVGAFHQPKCVLIDLSTLNSLDDRQFNNGLAESIKMGLTSDKKLFDIFKDDDYKDRLTEIIIRSLEVKKYVVEQDEKEAGLRKVLNFGHTLGHGIESYKENELYHGECVALGMLPMLSSEVRADLVEILKRVSLFKRVDLDKDKVMDAVMHDKKAGDDGITAVVVDTPGSFSFVKMKEAELRKRLDILVEVLL